MNIEIQNIDELKALLSDYRIPYIIWGNSESKTYLSLSRPLKCLFHELIVGSSRLIVEEGKLVRHVTVAIVNIYHPLSKTLWHQLIRFCRVLPNGRQKLYHSVKGLTKKVQSGESPLEAARRGIETELGLKVTYDLHPQVSKFTEMLFTSRSFPGLPCRREYHGFNCAIREKKLKHKVVVYEQPDGLQTHFKWVPVPIANVPQTLIASSRPATK